MEECFVRALLTDSVLVTPQQLGGNYREMVLAKLRKSHEGLCTRHGYIMPGSITLHAVAPGKVQAAMLNGNVRFDIQFFAMVCDPERGAVVPARVVNTNRFGILAHAGILAADGEFTPVIEAIIAKQADSFGPVAQMLPGAVTDTDALEGLKPGDQVIVQILGKRAQLRASCISVVGVLLRERPAGLTTVPRILTLGSVPLPPLRGALGAGVVAASAEGVARATGDDDVSSVREEEDGEEVAGTDDDEDDEDSGDKRTGKAVDQDAESDVDDEEEEEDDDDLSAVGDEGDDDGAGDADKLDDDDDDDGEEDDDLAHGDDDPDAMGDDGLEDGPVDDE